MKIVDFNNKLHENYRFGQNKMNIASALSPKLEELSYNDKITKYFVYATLLWGIVGLTLGVVIAFQLAYWKLNMNMEWLTFGRLRPLHTNAAIFAFVGNGMFAGVYYSTQRLVKARMFSDFLSKFHFWGWQLIIVAAAISYH